MPREVKVIDILNYLDAHNESYKFIGDKSIVVTGFSSLSNYKAGNITWIKNKDVFLENSNDSSIMLAVVQEGEEVDSDNKILTNESKRIFFNILEKFFSSNKNKPRIGNYTYLSPEVKIGENVQIGHNCCLDGEIEIGDNTRICNNVNIVNNVKIGANCVIQSLTTIGEDGFGYTEQGTIKTMVRHYGGVIIEDNVFVGTHVNIARGTIDDTVIKRGVKIAPSSHVGHNVVIEQDAAIICSKIFGSVNVGNNAYVSSCTVRNQCSIGDNTVIGMGAVVTKDIGCNKIAMGIPAKEREIIKDKS